MRYKFIIPLMLLIGGISFLTGSYGFYRLYDKADNMEHTTGLVTDINKERTYRHRKHRYKTTAFIRYKTKLYDNHISKKLRNPFIFEGSEISIWYKPENPSEVIIPFDEGFVWGCAWAVGALCIISGVVILKSKKHED